MKIKVSTDVNEMRGHFSLSLSDLGLTKEEWDNMDDDDKKDVIQNAVDEEPNQPCWIVDTFEND